MAAEWRRAGKASVDGGRCHRHSHRSGGATGPGATGPGATGSTARTAPAITDISANVEIPINRPPAKSSPSPAAIRRCKRPPGPRPQPTGQRGCAPRPAAPRTPSRRRAARRARAQSPGAPRLRGARQLRAGGGRRGGQDEQRQRREPPRPSPPAALRKVWPPWRARGSLSRRLGLPAQMAYHRGGEPSVPATRTPVRGRLSGGPAVLRRHPRCRRAARTARGERAA